MGADNIWGRDFRRGGVARAPDRPQLRALALRAQHSGQFPLRVPTHHEHIASAVTFDHLRRLRGVFGFLLLELHRLVFGVGDPEIREECLVVRFVLDDRLPRVGAGADHLPGDGGVEDETNHGQADPRVLRHSDAVGERLPVVMAAEE
nr:hypothetical protein Iba_chr15aCG7360 [Ipomoea batatas]